jgi:hypothetical protein
LEVQFIPSLKAWVFLKMLNKMDYSTWILVTKSMPFLIVFFAVFVFFFALYLIIASIKHAKTSDGRKLKSRMIKHGNTWIAVIVWIITGVLFWFLMIDPIWLKIFG